MNNARDDAWTPDPQMRVATRANAFENASENQSAFPLKHGLQTPQADRFGQYETQRAVQQRFYSPQVQDFTAETTAQLLSSPPEEPQEVVDREEVSRQQFYLQRERIRKEVDPYVEPDWPMSALVDGWHPMFWSDLAQACNKHAVVPGFLIPQEVLDQFYWLTEDALMERIMVLSFWEEFKSADEQRSFCIIS